MKKATVLVTVIALIFSLCSCKRTVRKEMMLGGNGRDITHVDIYSVARDNYIGSKADDSVLNIRENEVPIRTLEGEDIATFIDELMELEYAKDVVFPFHVDYAHLFSPGYVVFIEYSCGNCDVYAEKGIYIHDHYDEDSVRYHYSPDDCRSEMGWSGFINKYV